MGAKCTGPIPAGFPNDWAVLVQQARNSNMLCTSFDASSPPKCIDPTPAP